MSLQIYSHLPLPSHLAHMQTTFRQPETPIFLHYDETGLSLCKTGQKGRVRVDFVDGAARYRRTKGGGELIAKAIQHTTRPNVWDATGGLGRDSFVLASLGLNVRTFEQNPAVFALLIDGLTRALCHPETAQIAARITLIHGNAAQLLPEHTAMYGKPDVVYLDPMYPARQKSAAVKKEMAYFHELVGLPEIVDNDALLKAACAAARHRIVVKRPRLGKYLCEKIPAYQYSGKSTRFDVYLPFQAA